MINTTAMPMPIMTIAQGKPPRKTPSATLAISVACGAASGFGCSAVATPIP